MAGLNPTIRKIPTSQPIVCAAHHLAISSQSTVSSSDTQTVAPKGRSLLHPTAHLEREDNHLGLYELRVYLGILLVVRSPNKLAELRVDGCEVGHVVLKMVDGIR